MSWYSRVKQKLEQANIFREVKIVGAKIRAEIDETTFLDIYYDPVSKGYSYALIDLKLPYPGDKRVFGWDDYPHEQAEEIKRLKSYPHHFQKREGQKWAYRESEMRGEIGREIEVIIDEVKSYLKTRGG